MLGSGVQRAWDFPRDPGYSPIFPNSRQDLDRAGRACSARSLRYSSDVSEPVVLCAVDLGPSTARVLYHAVGLSRILEAGLRILHVSSDDEAGVRERVIAECERAVPYEAAIDPASVVMATGRVSEAVQREALRLGAILVVVGSRGHGGLARLLLGSTSEALLDLARTPVLLVPPTDMEIVSLADWPG